MELASKLRHSPAQSARRAVAASIARESAAEDNNNAHGFNLVGIMSP